MILRALKYFCDGPPVYGLNIPADQYVASGIRFLRTTDVGNDGRLAVDANGVYLSSRDVPEKYILKDGDLLLSRSGTLGRSLLYSEGLAPSTHAGYLVRFRPADNTFPSYLAYCAQSSLMQDAVAADASESTIGNFNAEKYSNVLLPWWTNVTQRAIAGYLDHELVRIDSLIMAKRRMVELMEARVRQTASTLMMKGGDNLALRRLVETVKTGTTPPTDELRRLDSGPVPWYSPTDVKEWLQIGPAARSLKTEALLEGWVPPFPSKSTLLIGIGATAGKVAYLDHPGSGNQQMTCLVPGPKLEPRFLAWQLFARRDELRATAPFTTLPILNNEFIGSILITVPSLAEQAQIVARLDEEALTVDALADRENRQVVLLQERRQALITAAVTGQLDIPEAA